MMHLANWIIKTFNNKNEETLKEVKDNEIDICASQETKRMRRVQKM